MSEINRYTVDESFNVSPNIELSRLTRLVNEPEMVAIDALNRLTEFVSEPAKKLTIEKCYELKFLVRSVLRGGSVVLLESKLKEKGYSDIELVNALVASEKCLIVDSK